MPLYDHAGNAPAAQLTATLTNVGLVISCDDLTNWPAGGGNGKFWLTLGRNTPNEERALGQSTSGNTITIAALGDRGLEDTAAVEHPAGTTIEHTFSKTEAQDANDHIFNTALDHHTQYMHANGARHDLTARHPGGSVVPTAVPVAIGTALAEGAGTNLAKSTHVHTIGVGAINNANMFAAGIVNGAALGTGSINNANKFAAGVVDSNALGALAVIAGKIAANAIDDHSLFAADTQPFIVQAGDPGAVGANKIWFDTTARLVKVRNAANSAWEIYGETMTQWADYTPTLAGVTLGSPGQELNARWASIGKTVVSVGEFILGTGGNVTGEIIISMPTAVRTGLSGMAGAQALDVSTPARWASVGLVDTGDPPTNLRRFGTAGVSWQAATPFNWAPGDVMRWFVLYEAA